MLRRNVLEKLRRRKVSGIQKDVPYPFDIEELDRDVATVLTTSNPYFVESAVEFSYKDREFKPLQNRNRAIVFYEQKGSIKEKPRQFQQTCRERRRTGHQAKNKFNYCDRATQTLNLLHVDKETQTEPLPQIVFDGTVSPADIFQAYLEKKHIKQSRQKKFQKRTTDAESREPETIFRFCERMIDQNLLSDVNIDFSFYDTPSDEFKDKGLGSLLALWKFSHQPMKGMPVTGLSWNSFYPDMFAVAFGTSRLRLRVQSEVSLLPREGDPLQVGVYCVEFNRERSYLLAVGFADGTVAVYDLRRNAHSPIAINKTIKLEHNDIVNQSELIPSEVINLRQNDMTTETPEKNNVESMSCGTSISFNPDCSDLFLIGTENGFIHKCSNLSTAQHLDVYKDHSNIVYNVHWNPYHPRVFLSCSADWTIRIWDHTLKESVFTFDLLNEVKDVTWAPFSSSLFAAVTSDGKVHIFDIMMNRQQPTSSYTVYNSKKNTNLTSVQFNPIKPVIIIGDDKGSVISFKLSPNLRSSLKAFQTLERLKFAASERDKMEKILKLARNLQNNDQEL
ncbi:dynein intermediate chain 1, axonemal [Caerostris extrusa]|uniref:Dynein intermediate chain 1, axonemal n=1 Tax=Caerostris extrusa TaxID=172846 RepID=A0AAV4MFL0_CAEEX|nr:dynein intermediate chain 1, axonemal [Caerostris extrusa]